MEYNENSSENRGGNSKFARKPNISMILMLALLVLAVIIIVEVFVLINSGKKNGSATPSENPNLIATDNNGATAIAPTDNNTKAPSDSTDAPVASETAENTDAPVNTNAQTIAPTVAPTPTVKPTTRPSVNPVNGLLPNGDIAEAKIIEPEDIDFSFLNGLSTEPFADAGKDANGNKVFDWYPGSVERLPDGTINKKWDRYASTLNLLEKYNGVYRKDESVNNIVLTFDCGYEFGGNTAKILDTLKAKNVKAIFFVTAEFTDNSANHDLLKRMYNEGHLIGNHTKNHPVMPKVSPEQFVEELNYVYKRCKEILGDDFTMSYYRPPQGACNERDLAIAQYLGYNTTFWSFAYGDYNTSAQPDEGDSLGKMKKQLHPCAVYLLHAISTTNANVLDDFIDYVHGEGFEIKRIDEA